MQWGCDNEPAIRDAAREESLRGLAAVSSTSLALWQEFNRLASRVACRGAGRR